METYCSAATGNCFIVAKPLDMVAAILASTISERKIVAITLTSRACFECFQNHICDALALFTKID